MKSLILSIACAFAFAGLALSFEATNCGNGGETAAGTPGVEDETCYKNNSDDHVSVEVQGTTFGDQKITITDGDGNSGSTVGTPHPNGGCSDSGTVTLDGTKFRIKDGDMQFQNPHGNWIDMRKTACDAGMMGGDDLGTLPFTGPRFIAPPLFSSDDLGTLP